MNGTGETYALAAEFETSEELLRAARAARDAGYRRVEAYSPFPVEGVAEALGFRRTKLPLVVLIGGIIGCAGGYWLQYWVSAIAYPLNIGGRPLNSWPAFVPVTFELTVLVAALFAVLGMLGLNGLPMPYHPLFNVSRFSRATQDAFFLSIRAVDPEFHPETTRRFLESLNPRDVYDVPQ